MRHMITDENGRIVDYIGSSVYQSVRPWLNMLAMYHGMGRRREFEVIAERLHEEFNLGLIRWDDSLRCVADGGKAALEDFPRILDQVSRTWDTPECLAYLNGLLEDNRAGERRGFSLGAFEELLLLSELQELRRPPRPVVPLESGQGETSPEVQVAGSLGSLFAASLASLRSVFSSGHRELPPPALHA